MTPKIIITGQRVCATGACVVVLGDSEEAERFMI